ncbi:MAG TPA: hypothetical protein VF591_01800 [Pyrinomonadaceae bacterium]|jgi:hypothetical protein
MRYNHGGENPDRNAVNIYGEVWMGIAAARSYLARLREYVGDRRRSPRRGARFVARVPAAVTILDAGVEYPSGAARGPSVEGETRDLGLSGLTVRVGRIRAGGQYLTDAELQLGVRLELPAGEAYMLAKAVRFESTPEEEESGPGYLLGLRILKVPEDDFALYSGYLRTLVPLERRSRERESGRQGVLELATPGVEIIPRDEMLTSQGVASAFEKFLSRGRPGGKA